MKLISQKLSKTYCSVRAINAVTGRAMGGLNTQRVFFSSLLFLIIFAGCSSTNVVRITTNKYLPRGEGVHIPLLYGDSDLTYERIGVIFVYGGKSLSREMINVRLEKQANEIGADAVTFIRYGEIEPSRYFKSYGSAYVNFEQARKRSSGSWIINRKPVGAGLAIRYKTRKIQN